MTIIRRKTKAVIGRNIKIGSDFPISIQSMTNTDTRNSGETIEQIKKLEEIGCDIVRVAVPDREAAEALKLIKKNINIPLVADIHFDYRLALLAIENGVDKLRLNPGNIGGEDRVIEVVKKAKDYNIPIRIGVNAGSIEKEILQKHGKLCPEALVESAMKHIDILEALNFENIVVSLKASDIILCYDSYKLIAKKIKYPLHIGITEAGTIKTGTIKSSIGVGALLLDGIGDTIRISLTGDPLEEVSVAREILQALNIRRFGIKFISCPTCGRCQIKLIEIANRVEQKLKNIDKPITVAIMGCSVNGPGEAREADIGIAGGKNEALLFKKGEIIRKIDENMIEDVLIEEIMKM
ncbi:MAG: flavodoxin-dependent (E)-4-hydroxy-3-methylbut-2-enyl-diphosphate synthase [Alkaliphilus sp.]|nr:flavodoxin-dependent (E)-4-hydroxy-3-methylbut-2-enyl-diphosphate synthase [Alkaliphilus sp.]